MNGKRGTTSEKANEDSTPSKQIKALSKAPTEELVEVKPIERSDENKVGFSRQKGWWNNISASNLVKENSQQRAVEIDVQKGSPQLIEEKTTKSGPFLDDAHDNTSPETHLTTLEWLARSSLAERSSLEVDSKSSTPSNSKGGDERTVEVMRVQISPVDPKKTVWQNWTSSTGSGKGSEKRSDNYNENNDSLNEKLKRKIWQLVNNQANQADEWRKEQEDLLAVLKKTKIENDRLKSTQKKLLIKQREYRRNLRILYKSVGVEKGKRLIQEDLLEEKKERAAWEVANLEYEQKILKLEHLVEILQEELEKPNGYGFCAIKYVTEIAQFVKLEYSKIIRTIFCNLSEYRYLIKQQVKEMLFYIRVGVFG